MKKKKKISDEVLRKLVYLIPAGGILSNAKKSKEYAKCLF